MNNNRQSFEVKPKQKRQRKHAGSESSLDSIRSREDATIINDNEHENLRHITQDSIELKGT